MKHFILVVLAAALSGAATAQDIPQSEVPSLVLNAFQSKFSNATDIEWEREGELFKVDFEVGNRDHDLWIDKSGTIKKHKEEIAKADLPASVAQKIKTDFKEYTVDDVDRIETDGKVFFYVDLDSRSGDKEVTFTADGTVQN
jgi:hypothetical protein